MQTTFRILLISALGWLPFTVVAETASSSIEEARNFHAVSADLLSAGQLLPEHMDSLTDREVELVINLAIADPERNAKESFHVTEAGLSYVQIPVIWDAPTAEDLEFFFAMMDARGGRRTLVHCFANYRASAFIYLYRVIREGVPEEDARKDLLAVWDDAAFARAPQWRQFIDDMLATYSS